MTIFFEDAARGEWIGDKLVGRGIPEVAFEVFATVYARSTVQYWVLDLIDEAKVEKGHDREIPLSPLRYLLREEVHLTFQASNLVLAKEEHHPCQDED